MAGRCYALTFCGGNLLAVVVSAWLLFTYGLLYGPLVIERRNAETVVQKSILAKSQAATTSALMCRCCLLRCLHLSLSRLLFGDDSFISHRRRGNAGEMTLEGEDFI